MYNNQVLSNSSEIIDLTTILPKNNIEFSLLSSTEYIEFKSFIPMLEIDVDWWLKSINYYLNEIYYISKNEADNLHHDKANTIKGIRPVMIINDYDLNLKPNNCFKYGKFNWTILSVQNKLLAICNDIVSKRLVDKNNYIYNFEETYLNKWLNTHFINELLN